MTQHTLTNISVFGAGTMGPGMAAVIASHGYQVTLADVQEEALEKARGTVEVVYNTLTGAGLLEQTQAEGGRQRLTFEPDLKAAAAGAEFVLETIPENLEIKHEFFRMIEPLLAEEAVLASNTSGIPITRLAEACAHPERVVGMHWSNPPHIIPVIEVIRGARTSDAAVRATHELSHSVGMIPVDVLRDVAGFVENRILYAIMREALHLVEQGIATPEAVDTITKWGIGYKLAVVGPLELLDVAGLDIYHSVASYLNADLSNEAGVSSAIEERVEGGKLGFKTGGGFYEYEPGAIPEIMRGRVQRWLATKKILMD